MSSNGVSIPIPTYRIDLGLPPEDRYVELAADFSERMRAVIPLFDDILLQVLVYRPLVFVVKLLARLLLRSVFDDEQTREIRSISAVAGVDLHLVVALNTLLDCLLGCTSGAVTVRTGRERSSPGRLMHFRTLDWGMPSLRDLLVTLEFVNSRSATPDQVLARSVSYAGLVGSLTGARPGFTFSLNYRPLSTSGLWLRVHHVQVLLGYRESISSSLRRLLLSSTPPVASSDSTSGPDSSLVNLSRDFAGSQSSPCYLIFCTPRESIVIQKDLVGGRIMRADDFIVQTNHDVDHTACCGANVHLHDIPSREKPMSLLGGEIWLEESFERQDSVHNRWIAHAKRRDMKTAETDRYRLLEKANANGTCIESDEPESGAGGKLPGITTQTLEKWLRSYPVTNECTHFAAIMDPLYGTFVFLERGPEEEEEDESSGSA